MVYQILMQKQLSSVLEFQMDIQGVVSIYIYVSTLLMGGHLLESVKLYARLENITMGGGGEVKKHPGRKRGRGGGIKRRERKIQRERGGVEGERPLPPSLDRFSMRNLP